MSSRGDIGAIIDRSWLSLSGNSDHPHPSPKKVNPEDAF
jgi:hypothetical protein